MDDKPLGTLGVAKGRNPHTRAGSVGGVSAYIDDDGRSVVILGIGERGGDSKGRRVYLHEGETFELGPELWEVTRINHADRPRWSARLTRLR